MRAVVKSQETRTGVRFRLLKDGNFFFVDREFQNYFYVKTKDFIMFEDTFRQHFKFCLADVQIVGQFSKIILSNNFMRTKVREFWESRCPTYEADIKANKRYLLDKKLDLNNEAIPYAFFDIETDDRLPLQKDDRGNVVPVESARILTYSIVDMNEFISSGILKDDTPEAEKELLIDLISDLSKYGILSGWNTERFDMPYIKSRCDLLGVDYTILDFVNHLCYMELFKKYDKKSRPSFSLNAISNEVLKESKIEQAKGNGAIYNTWKENPEQLLKYNIEDSNLVYKINKKRMFIEVSMKRANNAGCHVRNTMNNSDSGDFMIMRKYKSRNVIMPSEPTKEQRNERLKFGSISGGFTRCLAPGYYEVMDVYDQKSFYPMVVSTWNIGPETYVETLRNEQPDGALYPDYLVTPANWNEEKQKLSLNRLYRKEVGVFKELALELVRERDKIKYTMEQYKESDPDKYKQQYLEQYALKVDANSYFYGILGYPGSRYFNWQIADSITTCCQAIIKDSYRFMTNLGCTILGGDTDSTFVNLNGLSPDYVDEELAKFYIEWTKKWNIIENHLLMEHEKQVGPFLFVMKKNYAYKYKNEVIIKGLECLKSDSAPIAAKAQREFIMDVMNGVVDMVKWENKFNEIKEKTFNQELSTKDVTLIKGLTKMPEHYNGYVIDAKTKQPKVKSDGTLQSKAVPAHVKLAERLIGKGVDLYPGSKIKFVVIADKPILAITPEEFESPPLTFLHKHKKLGLYNFEFDGNYEAKYYWKRLIKPLLKVIYAYNTDIPDWNYDLSKSEMAKLIHSEEDDE